MSNQAETRSYRHRKGSPQNKFNLKERNAIRVSIKEIGVVATAQKFDSLPKYISAVGHSFRMNIKRGRKAAPKPVVAKRQRKPKAVAPSVSEEVQVQGEQVAA